MRGFFGSLVVRISVAFMLGLVLLQLVVAALVIWPEGRPTIFRLVSPEQAASIARALEAASPEHRLLIVQALNGGALVVHLQADFDSDGDLRRHDKAPYLLRLYRNYTSALEGRQFLVESHGDAVLTSLSGDRAHIPGAVRLLVALKTGDVLVIERGPIVMQLLVSRFAIFGGTAGAILLAVMLFCINQLAKPARRLAGAAHRLAGDIDMPDLPMRGASEIRMLSSAFNEMKRTIRDLIDERTRMLAAIAHDLRTYLTRLRLRVEFIEDLDHRNRAVHDVDEMSLLLDDTLLFAQETMAPDTRRCELLDASDEIASFVRSRQEIGEPVTLTDIEPGVIRIRCQPLALRRMLSNLSDNALRYGKVARISVRRQVDKIAIA